MFVSSEDKDKILQKLCSKYPLGSNDSIDFRDSAKELSLDKGVFRSVVEQFDRLGLLKLGVIISPDSRMIKLNVEAEDFLARGGFQLQEDILLVNLEKLDLEIEHLRKQLGPNYLESLNKLSGITGTMLSAVALLKSSN